MYYVRDASGRIFGMKKAEYVRFLTESIRHDEVKEPSEYGKERELPELTLDMYDEHNPTIPEMVDKLVTVLSPKNGK